MQILIILTMLLVIASIYFIYSSNELKKIEIPEHDFSNKFFNELYKHSHIFPLKLFSENEKEPSDKNIDVIRKLNKVGWNKHFTIKSFTAFNTLLFFLSMLLSAIVLFTLNNLNQIAFTFGITNLNFEKLSLTQNLFIFMFFLVSSLFLKSTLNQKYKIIIVEEAKEFPVLQMFVILMLKSNKTVSEILHSLSKLNTHHKPIFSRGYRIYLRNTEEGMDYYRQQFSYSKFGDMFNILEDLEVYSVKDSVRILENSMEFLVEESQDVQRKNDLTRLVYSQASMAIPFAALLLLGVVPIISNILANIELANIM